jgi:hypothetical protein
MAVLDFIHMGSSLSVRSLVRFGAAMKANRAFDLQHDGKTMLRMVTDNAQNTVEVRKGDDALNYRSISFTIGGANQLHGLWLSDEVIATSEGAYKTGIRNLEDYARQCTSESCRAAQRNARHRHSTLRRIMPRSGRSQEQGEAGPVGNIEWVLRELRPVAFKYKDAPDSKSVRFGFLAEELQKLLPEVVRSTNTGQDGKSRRGVVYQDLIALLAAGFREQQGRLEKMEKLELPNEAFTSLHKKVADMSAKIEDMEKKAQLQEIEQRLLRQELLEVRLHMHRCCGDKERAA